jgi:hypothetical protein
MQGSAKDALAPGHEQPFPMNTNNRRMVQIAVLVTGFAVGMAGLLNYFKYRAVADRLVTERLTFTGQQIENSIQASLVLGLQFSELGTLPATLQRLLATDDLTLGIDIFDPDGRPLYSTDQLRAKQPVPQRWIDQARDAGDKDWVVRDERIAAVGQPIKNQFGLTVGHVAIRYNAARVQDAALVVARQLALVTLSMFALAALAASLAMLTVMSRLDRDTRKLEDALRSGDPSRAAAAGRGGPFALALRRFVETTRSAETELVTLRAQLQRGGQP